jgi:uncharacterized membrane protein
MANGSLLSSLTLASTLGCGLIAGAFFAFSTFVMKALSRLPAPHGIAAMQSINIVVINPWFMLVFVGTALLCAVLMVHALLAWEKPGSNWTLLASLLYVVGTFGVTIACNVPKNDALAGLNPASSEAVNFWADYLSSWTRWNHVRTLAALAAAAALIFSLCARTRATA